MTGELRVGDMVEMANGMPGTFMVIRLLENNRARIKRWPILDQPPAEDVYVSDLRCAPKKEEGRE